jgi:hypothetical protein
MPRPCPEPYGGNRMKLLMIVRPGMIAVLCPRLEWFLGLMLLAGLSGCGPAPSDHATNPESRASMGAPSEWQPVSQHTPSVSNDPFTPAAFPASNYAPAPATQEEPAPLPEYLELPSWIAQALDAPEVSVRLQALATWAQQGAQAPLDPLVVALDDEDDDVRTKAMEIIEQQWAIEQEAEPEAEK